MNAPRLTIISFHHLFAEIAQKLTILGLPATAAQVQGSGDLSERIAFLEGLVDVALWAPEPTAVCASPSDATASGDHDSQCSRSDMDDGEDDFASNHELMGTICQSYSELFRHEVDLLPAEMIQGVEGNPRLDEIRLLIRQISSKVEEWQKERQAYDDLPKVAPQTVEELQEALSLACETLSAFAQDAQAFNQHFAQEYSQHVGVEPPQLHGIGPLAAKIINTYDDLVKVIERLGEFRGIHESLFGGKSPLKVGILGSHLPYNSCMRNSADPALKQHTHSLIDQSNE
ncbi:unnamed protein product [Ostreobium quekettii]|uniref:Uncharacterized protein n=1 Tax=Ostreobium quekettii TaxID=121088 RepID=A0A8S1IX89_9CHLO|nr:unnamed protein product [Ostreobium quekettii]